MKLAIKTLSATFLHFAAGLPSLFTVHPSLFTVHPSPFTVHRSPFTVNRSPFTVHPSPTLSGIKSTLIITAALLMLLFPLPARPDILEEFKQELAQLEADLAERNIPSEWLQQNITRENFRVYRRMESYFTNMSESRVSRGEITVEDYKQHFGVDQRVRRGLAFIAEHQELLEKVEQANGIHYELVVAILGMETNFAEQRQRGNFNVFNALVSQYVLLPNRRRFAANELAALYEYSKRIDRDIEYFIGSFAGASGWGQFIPTSLRAYFVSADGIDENTDIYSIEDTLFSIENYLAEHRLNRNTIDSPQRRRQAVFAYNRSNAYVDAVLYIYEQLKNRDAAGL